MTQVFGQLSKIITAMEWGVYNNAPPIFVPPHACVFLVAVHASVSTKHIRVICRRRGQEEEEKKAAPAAKMLQSLVSYFVAERGDDDDDEWDEDNSLLGKARGWPWGPEEAPSTSPAGCPPQPPPSHDGSSSCGRSGVGGGGCQHCPHCSGGKITPEQQQRKSIFFSRKEGVYFTFTAQVMTEPAIFSHDNDQTD